MNIHPEEMIIGRGEAEVDNYFRRVNTLTITLPRMGYLFYHTEIIEYICRRNFGLTGMTSLRFAVTS